MLILNSILFIFILYFINIYDTFLILISIDNFSFALDFIINICKSKYNLSNNNLTNNKEIINKNNNLYLGSTCERYIYIILCYVIYNLIYYFVTENYIIKYAICFSIIPDIFNNIYLKYNNYFLSIKEYKTYIIKIFLAEQVTNIIKYLSTKYIDDIVIDKEHIKDTLLETDTLISEIYLFIKNFLIVLLIKLLSIYTYIILVIIILQILI